jgi:hypothetical protein
LFRVMTSSNSSRPISVPRATRTVGIAPADDVSSMASYRRPFRHLRTRLTVLNALWNVLTRLAHEAWAWLRSRPLEGRSSSTSRS